MKRTFPFKLKLAAVAGGLVAVLGGGAAIAATQLTPKQESAAVVADAARQLGVDASKLDAALKKALSNRVDAAVAAGRITEAQGATMKEQIASGGVPLLGVGPRGGHHGGGRHLVGLAAAATYLGVTESALRSSLQEGLSLADVARSKGKTADALVAALVAAAKVELGEAVADGRLTEAQKSTILADLPARIAEMVERAPGFRHRGGLGHGGPPPLGLPDA